MQLLGDYCSIYGSLGTEWDTVQHMALLVAPLCLVKTLIGWGQSQPNLYSQHYLLSSCQVEKQNPQL